MDKKFFMCIAAMAALTLVSCSSDDLNSLSDNSSKNEAISFDGYLGRSAVAVNGSRGGVETKETLKTKGFGVFGKYTDGQTSDPDFFKNPKVTYSNSNKKWTYTPLKYWPTQGQIDFLAYAPYNKDQKLKENTNTFDFTVAPEVANQIDLLWANATGKITENFAGTTKEKVKFLFKHALSRLGYTIKLSGNYTSDNATFTLNQITLAGSANENTQAFYKTGTIDLSKTSSDGLWSNYVGKQNFNWVSESYKVESTKPYDPKNYLFVIPQDFSQSKTTENPNVDELYVIVKYTIDYKTSGQQINTVYKKLPIKFEQGKAYMLNLTIGLPIEFDIDVETVSGVEDWHPEPDNNIDSWDDIKHE